MLRAAIASIALLSLLGCARIKGIADDIPLPNPSVGGAISNEASQATASMISNLIRQVGKSEGESYIAQQVNNSMPVSRETLADVIFQTSLEELNKTGKTIEDMMIREMRIEAFNEAIALIREYNEQANEQVEVVD